MKPYTRLKILRLLCGMTQEELTYLVKVPRPTLGHYERGTYIPGDKSLERFAAIFGVEPGYIRYGSPVVDSQAWLPVIPVNARRKRETINDILTHLPDFIIENCFDSAISQILGDGGQLFFFGRNNHYTCLLLTAVDLATSIQKVIQSIIPISEMTKDENLTIQSYSAQDLDFYATHSKYLGRTFDVKGISRSLDIRRGTKNEIKKTPLSYVFTSLLLISGEYDLPSETITALSEFLIKKYEEVAPLPTKRINPSGLMYDIRMKIEELGGVLRTNKKK